MSLFYECLLSIIPIPCRPIIGAFSILFHAMPTQIQQPLHEPVGDAIPYFTAPFIVVYPACLFACWFDPNGFLQRRPFNGACVYNFRLLVHVSFFVL